MAMMSASDYAKSPEFLKAEAAAKAFRDKQSGATTPTGTTTPTFTPTKYTMPGQSKPTPTPMQPPAPSRSAQFASQYPSITPAASKVDYRSILDTVMGRINQPQRQFQYNPESDSAYQAAATAARSGVGTAQANTNARLRATGQGKSSYSETVANQIAQQAEANIANNIRPQYEQQAYGRFQNEQANDQQNLQNMLTVGQGYNNIDQQKFNNAITEAGVTGRYYPPAVQERINQVLALKQQAERPGVTSDQMGQFKSQADAIRGQLAQLGVDPSIVGYENDYNQAAQNVAANYKGTPTMQLREANLNAANQVGEQLGQVLQPKDDWSNLYNQTEAPFNHQVQQQNEQNTAQYLGQYQGVPTMQKVMQDATIKNMTSDNLMQAAAESRKIGNEDLAVKLEIWDKTGKAPDGIPGVPAGTQLAGKTPSPLKDNDIASLIDDSPYMIKQYNEDDKVIGTTVDPTKKDGLAQYIASLGLPADQAKQWFIRYGLWSGK